MFEHVKTQLASCLVPDPQVDGAPLRDCKIRVGYGQFVLDHVLLVTLIYSMCSGCMHCCSDVSFYVFRH